ncbi:MAG: Gmad2 immunoglobulin-like domain-containing protein [Saprospiraceae bacterium]|nr:Gmad2 immunoglobulin-like domain-containing protein [Saprospiraceae bacterium]
MKLTILLSVIILLACNVSEEKSAPKKTDALDNTPKTTVTKQQSAAPPAKTYSNKRFRDVMVERIGKDSFLIHGQGQIFEASFSWIVEDGHNELKKGFQMTDAGAPEWGKFEFAIRVQKEREHSTLMLVLFESSPKDGSRQYELPIMLY